MLDVVALAAMLLSAPAEQPPALKDCCATPDAAVHAYFAEVSGGPGARDWSGMKELLLEHGQFSAIGVNAKRENELFVQGSEEYLHHLGEYLKSHGFFQREVCRSLYVFSRFASSLSVYESRNTPEGAVIDRGIIALHLLSDGVRWYIASAAWHSESSSALVVSGAYPPGCMKNNSGGAG